MTDLTAEELASVAREVTTQEWHVVTAPNPAVSLLNQDDFDMASGWTRLDSLWWPSLESADLGRRSQALAVVEWLADAIEMGERLKRAYYCGLVRRYVRAKDITSLQRMVLELRTKS